MYGTSISNRKGDDSFVEKKHPEKANRWDFLFRLTVVKVMMYSVSPLTIDRRSFDNCGFSKFLDVER
jgi:hypothetical protein